MKRTTLLVGLALLATPWPSPAGDYGVSEVGIGIGPTWAMSGDSPFEEKTFKDDFDTGLSFNAFAVGPISDTIGWRMEVGRDKMSADADRVTGPIDGDYTLWRWQVGVQLAPAEDMGPGRPYFFATMGLAHEDVSIEADGFFPIVPGGPVTLEFDGASNFGMSFGGGYNYLIGDSWGLGGDIHINAGFFNDATRWWWTPSIQGFYRW